MKPLLTLLLLLLSLHYLKERVRRPLVVRCDGGEGMDRQIEAERQLDQILEDLLSDRSDNA